MKPQENNSQGIGSNQEKTVSKKSEKANTFSQVSQHIVTEKNDGQRLDNFLISLFKDVPKSHIYRIIRSGEIRVNGKRAKAEDKIQAGDNIRIPPIKIQERKTKSQPKQLKKSELPIILFEDRDLLVVDKPAGLACHGGSGISFGLIERLRASFPESQFLELAHRLDRDTSGVLVIAKTRKALTRMHEMIRNGDVHKSYLTLVKGDWVNDRQHVRIPLHKYVTPGGERRVRPDEEIGLPSHTVFKLRKRYGAVSYLEVDLETGRTHQIRVHSQSTGYPIVGDDKYGDFAFNEQVANGLLGLPFKRMFLHAFRLSFTHPVTKVPLVIEAPLPKECQNLLAVLEKTATSGG